MLKVEHPLPVRVGAGGHCACISRSRGRFVRGESEGYASQVMQVPVGHCEDFGGSHRRVLSTGGTWPDFVPVGFLCLHGSRGCRGRVRRE